MKKQLIAGLELQMHETDLEHLSFVDVKEATKNHCSYVNYI